MDERTKRLFAGTLVDYADKCVYLAKAQGKGRIITKVNAES